MRKKLLLVTIWAMSSYAQDVLVLEKKPHSFKDYSNSLGSENLSKSLEGVSGLGTQSGGGLAGLPVMNGLAGDRINISIDGVERTASCPNHMNPVLSYYTSEDIDSVVILPGVSPVSYGGDSIAGSLKLNQKKLMFSQSGELELKRLETNLFYKSNNQHQGGDFNLSFAVGDSSFAYTFHHEQAKNYEDGSGHKLSSTLFKREKHTFKYGLKTEVGHLNFKYDYINIPYQGGSNQYMDTLGDESNAFHLSYNSSDFSDYEVTSDLFFQNVNHYMNKIKSERSGEMPMYTDSQEYGANLKVSKNLMNHILSFGAELRHYEVDDKWPSVDSSMMMSPETFISLNEAKRKRYGLFLESESQWGPKLFTNFGIRADFFEMSTGKVHGYNNSTKDEAQNFNDANREHDDQHLSATLMGEYKLPKDFSLEFGFSRKNRSPNLYERYAWAGKTKPAGMAMRMVNWFGDGNGYVGHLSLKPETAHTLSLGLNYGRSTSESWVAKLEAYYTDIQDYIDVKHLRTDAQGRHYLQFTNSEADLYGLNLELAGALIKARSWGDVEFSTAVHYTRGKRDTRKEDLYHVMPWQGRFKLTHGYRAFSHSLLLNFVEAKKDVDQIREEPKTSGYTLFDYQFNWTFSQTIEAQFNMRNIFDRWYQLPLGGLNLVDFDDYRTPLAGMGRSFDFQLKLSF